MRWWIMLLQSPFECEKWHTQPQLSVRCGSLTGSPWKQEIRRHLETPWLLTDVMVCASCGFLVMRPVACLQWWKKTEITWCRAEPGGARGNKKLASVRCLRVWSRFPVHRPDVAFGVLGSWTCVNGKLEKRPGRLPSVGISEVVASKETRNLELTPNKRSRTEMYLHNTVLLYYFSANDVPTATVYFTVFEGFLFSASNSLIPLDKNMFVFLIRIANRCNSLNPGLHSFYWVLKNMSCSRPWPDLRSDHHLTGWNW